MAKLDDATRQALPNTLPAWRAEAGRDAIVREWTFNDFSAAWAFMSRVALLAEKHDHHPEWSNVLEPRPHPADQPRRGWPDAPRRPPRARDRRAHATARIRKLNGPR